MLCWFAPTHGRAATDRGYPEAEVRAAQTEDEAKVREIRNQEIAQIRIALGRRIAQNRQADLYYRLAELYLEGYRSEFLLEGRVHDRRRAEGHSESFIDRSRSKSMLLSGVKACKDVVSLGIPFSKLDRIYYFLGVNYEELDNRTESLKWFDALTRKFPLSPFVMEAYRELGDAAFEKGLFAQAQSYYELATVNAKGHPETEENYPRILHKLAWAYYRTRQFDRAIESMKQAISLIQHAGEKLVNLREEALRDMAIFMTETGRVDEALVYFKKVAGNQSYFPKTLELLGKQYERNVEPAKAAQVYEALLKAYPDDEASFRVLVKLVDLDLRRGRKIEALARLEGVKIPTRGDQDTQVAAQNLKAMMRRTATESHEKYRKDASKADLLVAEKYYTAYLDLFLSKSDPHQETPEIEMYLAEVKRDLGKSKEAGALYRSVLDSGDARYVKEAGALWTASLSEAIRRASPSEGGKSQATEPSALEKEFIDAADEMQGNLGDLPEGREAALKAAQVLAGYKSTQKDSIKRIKRLISKYPHTSQSVTGARLWIQLISDRLPDPSAQSELKDLVDDLQGNSQLLAADREFASSQLAARLREIESGMRVGAIATAEKEKDYKTAARGYEEFATQATKRELAEKAYSSAVAAYVKAGDFDGVDRVVTHWLLRFKDSPSLLESVKSSATLALILGRFDRAASLFERLGRSGRSAESIETAARISQGSGDPAKARSAWLLYLNIYPRAPGRFAIALQLAQSYEAEQDFEQAEKYYQYCRKAPAPTEAECGSRLADLLIRQRSDRAQAKQIFRQVAQARTKLKEISPWVGYARYRLADLMEQETQFVPLQLPEAQLKKALSERIDFLEPLSRAYQSAVDVGGPWGVAALDRLANWVLHFTNDLDAISPPETMSPEAVQAFVHNISAISNPLRKKAIDTWNKAYQNAVKGEILSPVLPAIGDRLADAGLLDPQASYPHRAQGFRAHLRLAGVAADGGESGRQGAMDRVRDRLEKNPQDAAAWIDYGNLLWGQGRPLLSRIAYDRALGLDSKSAAALNNRAVVLMSGSGEEDWIRAAEAQSLLKQALKLDSSFIGSLMNMGALFNYYRIFAGSLPIYQQVNVRVQTSDGYDGLAIALQGLGKASEAEGAFAKATDLGASKKRTALLYHMASAASSEGAEGASRCLAKLSDVDDSSSGGFEKDALEYLRRMCRRWKSE